MESCNGRLRDARLDEQWGLNLAHAQVVMEAGRREDNEKRLKQ
ncbi:MAG: hypothetical protein H8K05_07370 [Nitrospira sp.]|nr:hypothetical protein [Nitrospira sp.]MCS6317580.1 hypothetical protein [Nitrospira sp.]